MVCIEILSSLTYAALDGRIRVCPLECLFRRSHDSGMTLRGHRERITCLFVPDRERKRLLFSGSDDCSVRIWNMEFVPMCTNL